jgi:sugar porter (SP) family MFS transporter
MNRVLIRSTIAAALGGLLYGYDTVIINGALLNLIKYFQLTPAIQGWTVSSALVGCIIGSSVIGRIGDKYGAKLLMQILAILFFLSSFGCFAANTIRTFILFRFIGGLAIGASSVLCPVYISEVSPPKHRGLLTSSFQLSIVVGILFSLITNYLLMKTGDENWRWMLLSGAIPAVAFFFMLLLCKQSPRFLVKKGRIEKARQVIEEMSMHEIDAGQTVAEIQVSLKQATTNKINLFKKPYSRITLIGIFVGVFSQFTGIGVVFYYSSLIFRIAGFSENSTFIQSILLGTTNLIATLAAMTIIDKVGRKKLLLFGQIGIVVVLATFAFILLLLHQQSYWLVVLLILYIAFFAVSQGAVVWVLLSEMFPNKVRSSGTSVGSFSNWVVSALLNFLFPIVIGQFGSTLLEQQKGLGFSFIFLSITSLIGFFYLRRYIVETKGKTLEQIEKDMLIH